MSYARFSDRCSTFLLARLFASGEILLLTYDWEKILGYLGDELSGRDAPRRLMHDGIDAAGGFTLPCKDGGRKRFSAQRRFHYSDGTSFIAAKEIAA
jgi:hypothetical protein